MTPIKPLQLVLNASIRSVNASAGIAGATFLVPALGVATALLCFLVFFNLNGTFRSPPAHTAVLCHHYKKLPGSGFSCWQNTKGKYVLKL